MTSNYEKHIIKLCNDGYISNECAKREIEKYNYNKLYQFESKYSLVTPEAASIELRKHKIKRENELLMLCGTGL